MALFVFPAQSVTISGGATEAKQDVMITELQDVNTELDSQTTVLNSLDGKDFSTETTLSALNTKVPAQGAALIAASTPVNIASDQTVPVSASSLPLPTGAATESTLASIDGKDFSTETTLSALNTKVPAQGSALVAASLPVNIASDQTVPVSASSLPLPTGAATESTLLSIDGKDFATETTLASIDSKDFATLAKQDEQSAILKPDVVDQIDTTPLLDTSLTNIPASASSPLEIVASTAAPIQKVVSVEDIGEYIGLYEGAALSETLVCVLPLGGGEIQVDIPAGTRLSLRAMENTAIGLGSIALNLIG